MNPTRNDDRRFSFLKGRSRMWLDEDVYDDLYAHHARHAIDEHDDEHDGWSNIRPRRRARGA